MEMFVCIALSSLYSECPTLSLDESILCCNGLYLQDD